MADQKQRIGKLAMRHEGDNWNAYFVVEDTETKPMFLGSIAMGAIADNPERRTAFLELMRDVLGDVIQGIAGIRPTWGGEQPAPENERSGHS